MELKVITTIPQLTNKSVYQPPFRRYISEFLKYIAIHMISATAQTKLSSCRVNLSTSTLRHVSNTLNGHASLLPCCGALIRTGPVSSRAFSTSPPQRMRDIFALKETNHIRQTPPVWPHNGYSREEMLAVTPAHRPPRGVGDWVAWKIVRVARWGMDTFTGMSRKQRSDPKNPTTAVAADEPFTEPQWVRAAPPIPHTVTGR